MKKTEFVFMKKKIIKMIAKIDQKLNFIFLILWWDFLYYKEKAKEKLRMILRLNLNRMSKKNGGKSHPK